MFLSHLQIKSTTKRRPAVVVSSNRYNNERPDIILMPITSQLGAASYFGDVLLNDWSSAGLVKPSVIKLIFTTIEKGKLYEDTIKGLNSSAGFVRKLIGQRIRMKFTPQIRFIHDQAEDKEGRIQEILDIIHKEKEKADGN